MSRTITRPYDRQPGLGPAWNVLVQRLQIVGVCVAYFLALAALGCLAIIHGSGNPVGPLTRSIGH